MEINDMQIDDDFISKLSHQKVKGCEMILPNAEATMVPLETAKALLTKALKSDGVKIIHSCFQTGLCIFQMKGDLGELPQEVDFFLRIVYNQPPTIIVRGNIINGGNIGNFNVW